MTYTPKEIDMILWLFDEALTKDGKTGAVEFEAGAAHYVVRQLLYSAGLITGAGVWLPPEKAPHNTKILMTIQPTKSGDFTDPPFVAVGWIDSYTPGIIFGTGTRRATSEMAAWMPLPKPFVGE